MEKLTSEFSYFIGFAQSDGCLSEQKIGNKGKFTIELKEEDSSFLNILGEISQQKFSIRPRQRDTNFKKNYRSKILTVCTLSFRNYLKTLGMVSGRKDLLVSPPIKAVEKDYIRGYYDGNGSLGFTIKNIPIVSVTTTSDQVKKYILEYIFKCVGKKKEINRNSRDGIFNIALTGEDAVAFVKNIYDGEKIVLPRKMKTAEEILKWKRPQNIKRIPNKKFWTSDEDSFILSHNFEESQKQLKRSLKSIKIRYWRLTGTCPRERMIDGRSKEHFHDMPKAQFKTAI